MQPLPRVHLLHALPRLRRLAQVLHVIQQFLACRKCEQWGFHGAGDMPRPWTLLHVSSACARIPTAAQGFRV